MPSTYVTRQNDTWDAIAYRLWGQERLFDRLMRANPAHLDVVIFDSGVTLAVPADVDTSVETLELPPWMTS
jgi:phage tail protein X